MFRQIYVIYVWRQVMPGADRGVGPQNEHLTEKTKKKTKADWQNMCVIRRGSRIRTCRP